MTFSKIFILTMALFSFFLEGSGQKKKPNIVLVLTDDMGYSDLGCFGSEIETPHLDAICAKGFKMNHFYNTGRCCPSRAALLTGLYNHQAGFGHMDYHRGDFPAYQGRLSAQSITIAQVLQSAGYHTILAGKWHLGKDNDSMACHRGFDTHTGIIGGASSYFNTRPYRKNGKVRMVDCCQKLDSQADSMGYLTDRFKEVSLAGIKKAKSKNQPFFLYLAHKAPHWPLQALPEDIARFRSVYMQGWDSLRNRRIEKLKQLSLISKNFLAPPRDSNIPAWKSLNDSTQKSEAEKMAVYAAMLYRMDLGIGEMVNELKKLGEWENTLFIFLSDNGASDELMKSASANFQSTPTGSYRTGGVNSFVCYGRPWAWLSNAPFQGYKTSSFEGGISTCFFVSGPGIVNKSSNETAHIIDIAPSIYDCLGLTYPKGYTPLAGISLFDLWRGKRSKLPQRFFHFEHEGHEAVIQFPWKARKTFGQPWELFNLENDRGENQNLGDSFPQKLKEQKAEQENWAKRVGVVDWAEVNKTPMVWE
jgi:arylsulfatase